MKGGRNMFVIDCHDHIYMKRLAQRAVKGVGEFYDVPMACGGISDELCEIAKESPIKMFVVNAVAMNAKSVPKLNDFIAEECRRHPEFIGLGTLHPNMQDIDSEIERIISLGLKGIKLHPDTQQFDADSGDAMRIYERIEGRLPLLIHSGDYRYDFSHPRRIANIADTFPKLTMIAAHLGGWSIFEEAVPYMKDRSCYMDISSVMPFVRAERVKELIRLYGADRLLFGSDFPMWHPVSEYESFLKLGLSEEEQAKILYQNTAKIFSVALPEHTD